MAKEVPDDEPEPTPDKPAVTREKRPPAKRAKRVCPSCDSPTDGKFCGTCGVKIGVDGATETDLAERVARIESQQVKLSPIGKLVDRLAARGIDVDDVSDDHLDMLANVKKHGPASLLGGFGKLFPPLGSMGGLAGLMGGGGDDETEETPDDS